MGAAMDLANLLFTYTGRINRAKYWIAVLIYVIALVVILAIAYPMGMIGLVIGIVAYIVMVVSGVMVGIKRLHDRNKSGWWLLLFYLVPGVLSALGMQMGGMANGALSLIGFAITIWMIVELGCLRGTAGANQYGPDPLNQAVRA
jgi:uncharacterized membrane protein YhaH (DUF805 family)